MMHILTRMQDRYWRGNRWRCCGRRWIAGISFFLAACALLANPAALHAQEDVEELLEDPVVFGAWLYEGNCVRCHGAYGDERVGSRTDKSELQDKIYGDARESCRVTWGRANGGPLGTKDVKAIVAYILEWEELGGPPDLPELPPQPTPTPSPTPTAGAEAQPTDTPTPTPDPAIVALQPFVEDNEIAHGAWLYSEECRRCHGTYTLARMGKGVTDDFIKQSIENGKTGTSMPAFARKNGGELKFSEINAMVAYIRAYETFEAPPALPSYVLSMTQRVSKQDDSATKPIPMPQIPLVTGDLDLGEELYAEHCASCHGAWGEGGLGKPLAKEWGAVRPDLAIRSNVAMGVPGTIMQPWAQDEGGILSSEEVDAVTAYVLTMQPQSVTTGPGSGTYVAERVTPSSLWGGLMGLGVMALGVLVIGSLALVRQVSSGEDET